MGTIGWRDKNVRGRRPLKGRRAAIVGAGHTRFGVLADGPRALLKTAVDAAFASVDRGMDRSVIEEAFVGTLGFSG